MGSILAASLSAAGRSMRSPEDTPHADHGITRGTINVVMGNENGLVALTDSMLTEVLPNGVPRQLPTPGQKLFQLDRTSVCTVAGFIAAPIPFPEVEHT